MTLVENQFKLNLKVLKSDYCTEIINDKTRKYLEDLGVFNTLVHTQKNKIVTTATGLSSILDEINSPILQRLSAVDLWFEVTLKIKNSKDLKLLYMIEHVKRNNKQ